MLDFGLSRSMRKQCFTMEEFPTSCLPCKTHRSDLLSPLASPFQLRLDLEIFPEHFLYLFPAGSKGWPVSSHGTHGDNSSLCTSWRTLAAPLSSCSETDHSGTKYHLATTHINVLQHWGYLNSSWQCTRSSGEEIIRIPSFNSGEVNQGDRSGLYSHLSHSSPGCTGAKMPWGFCRQISDPSLAEPSWTSPFLPC